MTGPVHRWAKLHQPDLFDGGPDSEIATDHGELLDETPGGNLSPVAATEVYPCYWRFAAERHKVYMARVRGQKPPWTEDPIIREFKFTNSFRSSDRVSQYLIRHVIYGSGYSFDGPEVLFRVLLFKLFNKIETWEALTAEFGPLTRKDYCVERYDAVLRDRMARRERIYSAAYIMPPGGSSFGNTSKHKNHLQLLDLMTKGRLALNISRAKSMQQAYELLVEFPTIGSFLAYQFVTDINYSELSDFSEMDFVVPGPGARDGLRKCFSNFGGLSEPELIRVMCDMQDVECSRFGLAAPTLWGRRLQLVDCQNVFCEVSKYSRVSHPAVQGTSGRTRIKQKFAPVGNLASPWYPPKWGLNERIEMETISSGRSAGVTTRDQ